MIGRFLGQRAHIAPSVLTYRIKFHLLINFGTFPAQRRGVMTICELTVPIDPGYFIAHFNVTIELVLVLGHAAVLQKILMRLLPQDKGRFSIGLKFLKILRFYCFGLSWAICLRDFGFVVRDELLEQIHIWVFLIGDLAFKHLTYSFQTLSYLLFVVEFRARSDI